MVFTTERLFQVAIETFLEWDLNSLPLNSVQMHWSTGLSSHEFNWHSEPTFYSYSSFIVCSVSGFILGLPLSVATFIQLTFSWANHMIVVEWAVIYGIYHWRIVWSRNRKFSWVEFKPMITEFGSDALTDWATRPWVQLTLRANLVQLLQFHLLFSVRFHFGFAFVSRHVHFIKIFLR